MLCFLYFASFLALISMCLWKREVVSFGFVFVIVAQGAHIFSPFWIIVHIGKNITKTNGKEVDPG